MIRKSIMAGAFLIATLAAGVCYADDGDTQDGGQDVGVVTNDGGGTGGSTDNGGGTDVTDNSGSDVGGDSGGSVDIKIVSIDNGPIDVDGPSLFHVVMDHAAPPGDLHLVAIDPLPGDQLEGKAAAPNMKTAMAVGAKDAHGKKK